MDTPSLARGVYKQIVSPYGPILGLFRGASKVHVFQSARFSPGRKMAALRKSVRVTGEGDKLMYVQKCPVYPEMKSFAHKNGNESDHFNVFAL